MLDTYKQVVVNQYEAVLAGLNFCIDRCPDALWNDLVGSQPFCQVVFHALFYGDVYLGYGLDGLRISHFIARTQHRFATMRSWRIASRCFFMSGPLSSVMLNTAAPRWLQR